MKQISKIILYLFLVVITDPYKGIRYNEITVYETNYCRGYHCQDKDPNYYYDLLREDEELEEYKDDPPLVLDFNNFNK